MKLRDLFRGIGERFRRRSHSAPANGAAPAPQDQAPAPTPDQVPWAGEESWRGNPLYIRSQEAFYQNLSDLMKTHEEEWVAYHGDEYVIAAGTINEAWDHCLARGMKPGEFAVLYVHNFARDDQNGERWDEGGEINGEAVDEPPPL
jgi:hypothetical protein